MAMQAYDTCVIRSLVGLEEGREVEDDIDATATKTMIPENSGSLYIDCVISRYVFIF